MKNRTTMVVSIETDSNEYDPAQGDVQTIMDVIADCLKATAPAGAKVECNVTTATVSTETPEA